MQNHSYITHNSHGNFLSTSNVLSSLNDEKTYIDWLVIGTSTDLTLDSNS